MPPHPPPLVGLTIRATITNPVTGAPLEGAVATLTATVSAQSPAGNVLLPANFASDTADASGNVEWLDVLASDSPGLSDQVPYTVTVVHEGRLLEPAYYVLLLTSAAVGGVIRLDDLPRAQVAIPLVSYVLAASVGAVGGPAGPLDAGGKVPAAQLPVGGGSIPATIVDAAGDLVGATADNTPARVPAGITGQFLKADTTAGPGVVWVGLTTSDVFGLTAALAALQPLDTDLTALAALAPGDGALIQRVAGAWAAQTTTEVKASLTLVKGDVGLSNVDNTADANKPVSTAQQTALDAKTDEATLTTKGDLYVATGPSTLVRLPVGSNGQALVADSAQATGVRWATRTTPAYDPAMDGLIAVAADPALFQINAQMFTPGWAARMPVPAGKVITGALTCIGIAGTLGAGGTNGFAINDDTGALVANTADDNDLWTSTGVRSKAFPSPVAAQTADRYLHVSLRQTGYTVEPALCFTDGQSAAARLAGLMQANARSRTLSGSSWGSFDPTSGGGGGGYMPFLALY